MTSVFVSYTAADRRRARRLVNALERDGVRVWWDRRLRTGDVWDGQIGSALKESDLVIVLWSKHSLASTWVRAEAHAAFDGHKIRSVLLDDAKIPVPFNVVQYTDLSHWLGSRADSAYLDLLSSLSVRPSKPRWLLLTRRLTRAIGLATLPLFAAALNLTEDLERIAFHGPLLRFSGAQVQLRDVSILPVPAPPEHGDAIELRRQYPAILEALRARGVREVFFDMTFARCHPDRTVDQAFAAAIARASTAGTSVALGISIAGKATAPCPTLIGSPAEWVSVDFLRDYGLTYTSRFAAPQVWIGRSAERRAVWHAGVAMSAFHRGAEPSLRDGLLQVGRQTIALSGSLIPLKPTQSPRAQELLTWPDPGSRARGQVVVIGNLERDRILAIGGEQPGPVVHAGLIQSILDGEVPRDTRRAGATLLTAVAGTVAVIVARYTRSRRRVSLLLSSAILFLAVTALAANAILLTMVPAGMAVALGTALTPRTRRK